MPKLRAIAENIWGIEDVVSPGAGFRMPARATVVRLADGDLVLHSPLAIDDATAAALAALGAVKHIIAPSCIHWLFVKAAHERYPDARVLGAEGLQTKLTARSGVRFESLERDMFGDMFGDELRMEPVAGVPSLNEHVFLHAASRSLVVSDLVFNVHAGASLPMSIVLWLNGAYRKTAQSRVWRLAIKDRAAAAASAAKLLAWDFERVVVGHGDVVEDDARDRMRTALRWMLEAPGRALPASIHA